MNRHIIMAIGVNKRSKHVPDLQKVLTEFGCIIKMRLGLHEAGDACSDDGLIILHLAGDKNEMDNLLNALNQLDGIRAKLIEV